MNGSGEPRKELHLGLTFSKLEIYFELPMARDRPNIHYKDSKIKGWWPPYKDFISSARWCFGCKMVRSWLSVNFGSLGFLLIQLKFKKSNLGCVNPIKKLERNSHWSWSLMLIGSKLASQYGLYLSILPKMSIWIEKNNIIQIENYSTDIWKSKRVLLIRLTCTG